MEGRLWTVVLLQDSSRSLRFARLNLGAPYFGTAIAQPTAYSDAFQLPVPISTTGYHSEQNAAGLFPQPATAGALDGFHPGLQIEDLPSVGPHSILPVPQPTADTQHVAFEGNADGGCDLGFLSKGVDHDVFDDAELDAFFSSMQGSPTSGQSNGSIHEPLTPLSPKSSAGDTCSPSASSHGSSQTHAKGAGSGGSYRCRVCPEVKETRAKLSHHMKRHTRPFACRIKGCGHRTSTSSELERHEKKTKKHGSKIRYQCPRCFEEFTRKDNLQRHERITCNDTKGTNIRSLDSRQV
jgi:hypothetical protein